MFDSKCINYKRDGDSEYVFWYRNIKSICTNVCKLKFLFGDRKASFPNLARNVSERLTVFQSGPRTVENTLWNLLLATSFLIKAN